MPHADIAGHWASQDIYALIVDAVEGAGISPDSLTQGTLAPLDHFHARGLAATVELAESLPVEARHRLLATGRLLCAREPPCSFVEAVGQRQAQAGALELAAEASGGLEKRDANVYDGALEP